MAVSFKSLETEPPLITSPERTFEDHEKVLDKLSHWPRVHNNCVLFRNNPEKYYLLKRPQVRRGGGREEGEGGGRKGRGEVRGEGSETTLICEKQFL